MNENSDDLFGLDCWKYSLFKIKCLSFLRDALDRNENTHTTIVFVYDIEVRVYMFLQVDTIA